MRGRTYVSKEFIEMEQLLYNIDNTEYLLIEMLVSQKTNVKQLDKAMYDFKCIHQGIAKIELGGFWHKPYSIVRILVPVKNIHQFYEAIN